MKILVVSVLLFSTFLVISSGASTLSDVKIIQCDHVSPTIRRLIKKLDNEDSIEDKILERLIVQLKDRLMKDYPKNQTAIPRNTEDKKKSIKDLGINENLTTGNKTIDTKKKKNEKTLHGEKHKEKSEHLFETEKQNENSTEILNEKEIDEDATENPLIKYRIGDLENKQASDDKQTSKEDIQENKSKEKQEKSKAVNDEGNARKDESKLEKNDQVGNGGIKKDETSQNESTKLNEQAKGNERMKGSELSPQKSRKLYGIMVLKH